MIVRILDLDGMGVQSAFLRWRSLLIITSDNPIDQFGARARGMERR